MYVYVYSLINYFTVRSQILQQYISEDHFCKFCPDFFLHMVFMMRGGQSQSVFPTHLLMLFLNLSRPVWDRDGVVLHFADDLTIIAGALRNLKGKGADHSAISCPFRDPEMFM